MKKIEICIILAIIFVLLVGCDNDTSIEHTESISELETILNTNPSYENSIVEKNSTHGIKLKNIRLSINDAQPLDTDTLYFTEVLGSRKRYLNSLPSIVGFQYPYIYYERMTVMTEGASSEDADLYIGRYSVETGESQEFGIESFTAVSDEARLVINKNLVVYMYCSSDEQGSMIMKIELFDFDNNTKKLLSTNTVHNVFGYAKQISSEEAVFLLYEQVGDDTEQILLYYNLTTEELREIYRGEDIHGYSEGSISSKDIWAIDTDGGNIYLLMQQYENTQMKFYLRVIDTQGNMIQETELEALSMYDTIGDTADSLIVKGNYVILHYSQWTKNSDNTNALVSILCKEDSGYKFFNIESTVRPKNLYLGKAYDTPYVFFNTVDKKEELFILNTETGEEITLTLLGDGIRGSAVDSNGNLLVETRVGEKTEWYLFGGDFLSEK